MNIVSNIIVTEGGVEHFKVSVVYVLEYQAGGLAVRIADNIQQLNNVGTSTKILKDLYLSALERGENEKNNDIQQTIASSAEKTNAPFNLLFLYRFQNFDNASLSVININAFKDLTVFSPSNLSDNFVVFLISESANTPRERLGDNAFQQPFCIYLPPSDSDVFIVPI